MTSATRSVSWRPYAVLAVGLLAVSFSSILIRFAQSEQASSLLISAWRVTVAALVLTPFALSKYRDDLAKLRRSDVLLILLSGIMLGLHFASWISSLEYTSVTNSTVLVSTNSLWVALASPFLLRERLSKLTIAAVIVALAGVVWIGLVGGTGTAIHQNQPLLGSVLAVIGALAVSAYYMIGRSVRARLNVIPYIWLTYSTAAVVLFAAVLLTNQPVIGLPLAAYFWMTLTALVSQLIGHSAYNYVLGYLSATYVSLAIPGEPVVATVLAAIFLGERIDPKLLPGAALVLIAIFVASREESRTVRQIEQEAAPA